MSGQKPKKLVKSLRNSLLDLQTEASDDNNDANDKTKYEEVKYFSSHPSL